MPEIHSWFSASTLVIHWKNVAWNKCSLFVNMVLSRFTLSCILPMYRRTYVYKQHQTKLMKKSNQVGLHSVLWKLLCNSGLRPNGADWGKDCFQCHTDSTCLDWILLICSYFCKAESILRTEVVFSVSLGISLVFRCCLCLKLGKSCITDISLEETLPHLPPLELSGEEFKQHPSQLTLLPGTDFFLSEYGTTFHACLSTLM